MHGGQNEPEVLFAGQRAGLLGCPVKKHQYKMCGPRGPPRRPSGKHNQALESCLLERWLRFQIGNHLSKKCKQLKTSGKIAVFAFLLRNILLEKYTVTKQMP